MMIGNEILKNNNLSIFEYCISAKLIFFKHMCMEQQKKFETIMYNVNWVTNSLQGLDLGSLCPLQHFYHRRYNLDLSGKLSFCRSKQSGINAKY